MAAASPGHVPITPADAARAQRVRAGVLAEHGYDVPCVWLLAAEGPGAVLEWPPAAESLFGHPAGDVIGRSRSALLESEPADARWEDVERALREHGRWEGEVLHLTRDGRRVLTESRLVLVDEPAGRVSRAGDPAPARPPLTPLVVEIARDVTGRRRAEEALRASQERLAAIIESALDAIVATDADGRVVLFNAAAERLFGVRAAAALGEPLARFLRGHRRPAPPGTMLGVRADGSEFPVEAATSEVDTPEGHFATVIVRDMTERLYAEAERERLIDLAERERVRLAELARHADAARAEADAARQEAEAASQAKSAFLATMSHELRTPLNAVLGYVDLLDLGIAGEVTDAQRAYIDRIGASGRHLLGLINDVLDLAKIEAGQMAVGRQPYAARGAVRAALAVVRPHAAARSLALEDDGCGTGAPGAEADGPTYLGDERRVQQILVNLLSNAVKFTAPGGRVSVACATTREPPPGRAPGAGRGAWVTVRVADTGVGIAPEQHELVFARFHQVEHDAAGPYRRTQGGTGLGLAISRELARLMGGDLTVESETGSGSAFTLWLPAAAPAIAGGRGALSAAAGAAPTPKVAIGALLAEAVPAVVAAWVERLRADPLVPHARGLARAEIEDHLPSYVADFAQQFVIFDDPGAGRARVGLVRDGQTLRHLIARQHGAQRAHLGWDEAALAREFSLLGEELERALAAGLADVPPGTVDDARELVRAWLADAVRESAAALRGAGRAGRAEAAGGAPRGAQPDDEPSDV